MKPICIGTLCSIPFTVYAADYGGSFDCATRKMTIGIGRDRWDYTLAVLIHEATEAVYALKNLRFSSTQHYEASDSYVFQFNHHEFSCACDDVADFLARVIGPIEAAWKKRHPTGKHK